MFFITYSEQIMHLSFACGAILISLALAWLLFTVISIVRDIKHVLDKIKHALNLAHEVTSTLKQKIHDFSIQFQAISSGLTTVMDWIDKKTENKNKENKQENKNDDIKED